jgi:hypothetical protein
VAPRQCAIDCGDQYRPFLEVVGGTRDVPNGLLNSGRQLRFYAIQLVPRIAEKALLERDPTAPHALVAQNKLVPLRDRLRQPRAQQFPQRVRQPATQVQPRQMRALLRVPANQNRFHPGPPPGAEFRVAALEVYLANIDGPKCAIAASRTAPTASFLRGCSKPLSSFSACVEGVKRKGIFGHPAQKLCFQK